LASSQRRCASACSRVSNSDTRGESTFIGAMIRCGGASATSACLSQAPTLRLADQPPQRPEPKHRSASEDIDGGVFGFTTAHLVRRDMPVKSTPPTLARIGGALWNSFGTGPKLRCPYRSRWC
jgi:hypothetical protein